ncbi:MAG: PhnD/SsuA/transferrin family substrate-binding protein [Desulfobulbaceae bacterium]|nr:PhnD/SsuA/transferrin family substrate-binding protein [Desulfobulbaceae bacterium]HIJ90980.1 PhnD/SsuA/transferrin family substrate-binding protein [Deltaproteobacteria bacterium]
MPGKPFIRLLMLLACLLAPIQAQGAEPVKIGVLSFRPKPQTLAKWNPLAVALKEAMPERDFVVQALTYPELNQAVAARQLDFVLTNSGHYVVLKKRSGLSSPLATLAVNENGLSATVFGGAIFSRAGQAKINTLGDIKGKTVSAVNVESLGGYQMQAYELSRAGISLERDVNLVTTGMPHDKVVEAVLAGRAEVGFVRSGVLESMVREGRFDIKQLKILNRQNLPDFPLQVSTRLYPEWPFAAMPHIDENLARHVAAVLFVLEDNAEATRTMGIHGFIVPADYSPVEELLRELRLPPFDVVPHFTSRDIWARYRWQTMGGMFAFGTILILGVGLLLTNRKLRAKHRLVVHQQQTLEASEEKFRTVADYTLDMEYWEGARREIIYMSPSCEAITGYSRDEFIADPDLFLRVVHPDDRDQWDAHRHDIGNQEDGMLNFRVVRRDGGIRWLEHICHPVWSNDGVFRGRRVSNRDISERKRLESELLKIRNLESLAILAGGIAHDFNNLFQVLVGNIQLAKMNTEESSEVYQYLKQAEQAAGLATKLTSQLIAFSSEGNKLPINIQPVSYIMNETVAILEGSDLLPEFDLAENLLSISVDPAQFRNVIKQVVLNAKEAMPAGSGGTLRISAVNEHLSENHGKYPPLAPGNYVKISIEDQGCGISKENLPHIFDPYFSTKQRGSQKGMGLGLTLCDTIIRRHGGAITVESEPGKGTGFHLYFPAVVV